MSVLLATGIERYEQAFEGNDWGRLQLRPPDVTFENGLTLHAGDILRSAIHDMVVLNGGRRIRCFA